MNKNYEYVHVITLCGFPLRIQLTGQFVSAEQSVDGHISASPGIWPMADCYIVLWVGERVREGRVTGEGARNEGGSERR